MTDFYNTIHIIVWIWGTSSLPPSPQKKEKKKSVKRPKKLWWAELKKTASTASGAWGTFWMAGEHFGPKFTLFCPFLHFVGHHTLLTKVK